MEPGTILFLSRADVRAELSPADCLLAVEDAFKNHALGRLPGAPAVLASHMNEGGFHVKTAALGAGPAYFAAKINGNFHLNPSRHGLPAIQGLIALFDAERGAPLAVMDSIEITTLRTAAATALAARHLARTAASVVTICGCGDQGRSHLRALGLVRPIRRAMVFDSIRERARRFAEEMAPELGIDVVPVESLREAISASDICVTCTPSRHPVLSADLLRPGMFIAAVGADSPEKQELEPEVLRRSKVVVDLVDHAATIGELHHAIAAGVMRPEDIHAELGQILLGEQPGRVSDDEVFVFDSTGTALQDVAAAKLVYQRAIEAGQGTILNLAG